MDLIIDAIKKESLPHVIDILEKKLVDVNDQVKDDMGDYLLHIACYFNKNIDICKKLLEKGANINVKNNNGVTPIMYAIQMNNSKIFEYLVVYPTINVNIIDTHGGTILHYMIRYTTYNMIEYALKNVVGLNLEIKHYVEGTALQYAVKMELIKIIELLIKFNADINVRDGEYKSLLMKTIINKSYIISKILIKAKCDINAMDSKNNTALYYSAFDGDLDIMRELLRSDANPNIRGEQLLTPLMIACINDNKDIATLLLKYKAKKDILCIKGRNAKSYASENKNLSYLF